jgi:hypothetical protein
MDLKEQILVSLGLNKSIKLAWQEKAEDGTIFVSEADTLVAGADISVLTEDGTTILLPVGTYRTESGIAFRVDEDGIVAEVMETSLEDTEEVVEEETFADVGDWEGMEKRIQNLEDAVADLKGKVGESVEMEDEEEKKEEELEDEAVEVAVEETVVEVVEVVEEAVAEIATAIDDATPAEVTPELAAKAAEVAIEIIQEKAEEVAEEVTLSRTKSKRKFSKAKASKVARLNKKIKSLKSKLSRKPANNPLNVNKFSSNRSHAVSAADYRKMSSKEKFMYDLNR